MIKPNDSARDQMRKCARDMQALIELNERIAMEWRTMVVALEGGDLAGAQAARLRANALSPEGSARCEVAAAQLAANMPLEVAQHILTHHRASCQNPKYGIAAALVDRISHLTGGKQ